MSEKLSEAARQARNKYSKEWRQKNPEKVKKHNIDYWERQAKKLANDED